MKHFRNLLYGVVGLAALSLVAYLGSKNQDGDTTLPSLFTASEADAECAPFVIWGAHGVCYELTGNCFFDTEATQCNPYGH